MFAFIYIHMYMYVYHIHSHILPLNALIVHCRKLYLIFIDKLVPIMCNCYLIACICPICQSNTGYSLSQLLCNWHTNTRDW